MKIKAKDLLLTTELVVTLLCFAGIAWTFTSETIGVVSATAMFFIVITFSIFKCSAKMELTTVLILPVMLSAFQNVYLGMFSLSLSASSVQILTIMNFIYVCIIFVVLLINRYQLIQKNDVFVAFVVLVIYSFFSVVFLKSINILSIVSSMRNIISAFLFFFIGIMASYQLSIDRLQKMILVITFVVVIVGLYEVVLNKSMWTTLNITDLWTKKGIRLQPSGLPTSFYSSERINGERIRRMASTFADPVNLGSFLFAGLCIAWYRNNKILLGLVSIAIALTVSKGALLGILIFICVYSYYYSSKMTFYGMLGFAGLCGVSFLLFAMRTSANSVFLHISGLIAAFKSLLRHPLGYGLGSNGVLARQFSGYSANADITETGLGMIIGQLGFVGFVIYTYFFIILFKSSLRLNDKRETVLCLSLVLSVAANIFFNEVALSPNSCAVYFMIVGYYVSTIRRGRVERDVKDA